MNLVVNQNIVIHQLKVNNVTNSSVLQIGTAGLIKPLSNIYNSGGYTQPAAESDASASVVSLVPLPKPS
ncbi:MULTISPECIES: spore germination protein GerPB [Paenibacillus]|uniref:Spore germination protein GerPB n=1 Tax=Paenibacillus radicis (ex Xue et al. 2023) TaxID=2972489 RepID=A0ABT1YFI9_9BACL|nr:spore germination protein GerPB [Paenibacillus radicis (ex Xue et al. 2023)]MCR8630720.1 spore germination protein GerPB [Paenibacillus radicis (ex Xue et al. 2023)]